MADKEKEQANPLVENRKKTLEGLGRQDLLDLFEEWAPRKAKNRKRGAPLDQRISISVTDAERIRLDREVKTLKKRGEKISMSQYVRNCALGSVDVQEWKSIAGNALRELEDTYKNRRKIEKRSVELESLLEEELDEEEEITFETELASNRAKLRKIIAVSQKRTHRLSGRMSMSESETVKWRAQRLCISTSDYLRLMIFNLIPDGDGDAHMSLDAKRRFYVSIVDVANNGWGDMPTVYECKQCENYMDEVRRLRDRVSQLENFV